MYRIVCLFVLLSVAFAKHEIYDGHTLFEVTVQNTDQAKLLNRVQNHLNLDVWSQALPSRPGQVLVARNQRMAFQKLLEDYEIRFKVEAENIKELLDLEDKLLSEASKKVVINSESIGLTFDRIYTYSEVNAFLENLAANYPQLVTLVNAGKSFEGRDIKYIRISTTSFENLGKPVVYMQSLLHAREWVTLPATLYAIYKLVIDVSEQDLLQNIDWVILPIANPDGYEHTHAQDRFWRKNRATGYMANDICSGVDLNRNFDINWSTASSNIVCMDTFHGRGPFSEPETAIIRDIIEEHRDRLALFLDIHSFGSMILYGYGNGTLPANGLSLHLAGVQMAQAIDSVKTSWNPDYIVGNVALVLYDASGSAGDYCQSIGALSYTYELPGYRYSLGTIFGFLVDPNFIEQAGFETWEGIKAGARYALNNY